MRGPSDAGFRRSQLTVELMAGDNERAQRLLAELRVLMRRLNVYRSRVVTLSETTDGFSAATKIELQSLPRIERDALILPAALLARLERSTIGFSRHREILLSSGRHLKRGLLLYGRHGGRRGAPQGGAARAARRRGAAYPEPPRRSRSPPLVIT
ncbi:hypothetical protein [Sorangium sp. So ce542]|uniref:hypothetical protein n=1 Tax=Sorangium sp. So ce542 TaxID=3133316 RepID=UPI003F5E01BE